MGVTRLQIKPFAFDLDQDEIEYFKAESEKILRSGVLILGPYTERFEKEFADFIGTRFAVSVNTGSTALEILLRIRGVRKKIVLVPTNTNFATVAAIIRAGGRVKYLDMEKETFAPSLAMIKTAILKYPDAAGVLWVHIGGIISPEFPDVVEYCQNKNLFVFEDAAHAHGSRFGGKNAGNLADGAAFSFFPTKVMTTGEGGIITTNEERAAVLARSFRNQGKRGVDYGGLHEDFGNSGRMMELSALLGLIQLKKLGAMLHKREAAYQGITRHLEEGRIEFVSKGKMERASHYKLIVLLPQGKTANSVKAKLAEQGVFLGGSVYEIPCHQQPVFKNICRGISFPNAEAWCPQHICPPLTSKTTEEEADYIGRTLKQVLS